MMRGAGREGINTASRLLRMWRENAPLATVSAGVAVHRPKTSPQATYARGGQGTLRGQAKGTGSSGLG